MSNKVSFTQIWTLEKCRQKYTGEILNDDIFDTIVILSICCKEEIERILFAKILDEINKGDDV
ncbi:MAG: hypothetical protein ACE5HX_05045 [bacterium]